MTSTAVGGDDDVGDRPVLDGGERAVALASAPTAAPAASRGSHVAFCSSEPASRIASAASTVPRHGPGATPAPSARAMTWASTRPSPSPSNSSGTVTASQPCSPAAFHSVAGLPSPSVSSTTPRTAARSKRSAR